MVETYLRLQKYISTQRERERLNQLPKLQDTTDTRRSQMSRVADATNNSFLFPPFAYHQNTSGLRDGWQKTRKMPGGFLLPYEPQKSSVFPVKMLIVHSYVAVYQKVNLHFPVFPQVFQRHLQSKMAHRSPGRFRPQIDLSPHLDHTSRGQARGQEDCTLQL